MRTVMKSFFGIAVVCIAAIASAQTDYRNHMLIQVRTTSEAQLRHLFTFKQLDIIPGPSRDTPRIAAYPEDLELLDREGFNYDIIHQNLEKFYADRLGRRLDDMGGYHTFSEIVDFLDQIHADHPGIVTEKFSIGQTLEGREQWCVKISDNPNVDEIEPELFFNSLIHAREGAGLEALLYFMDYITDNYGDSTDATYIVNNREIWFIPCLNPDGYVYNETTNPNGGGMWRKNRRNNGDGTYGVDPNRNWTYLWGIDDVGSSPVTSEEDYRGTAPFSEPMTNNMRQFIESRNFVGGIDNHTYGSYFLYPWGTSYVEGNGRTDDTDIFEMIADSMAYYVHEVHGVWYTLGPPWEVLLEVNGCAFDWEYATQGMFSVATEVGNATDGFWPEEHRILPLCEENLPGHLFVARFVGTLFKEFTLSDRDASPVHGTVDSTYTFSIIYTSKENISPATAEVYINDVAYTMTTTDYDYTDGSLFTYETSLASDRYEYYFYFVGDTMTKRHPDSGTHAGPLVGGSVVACYDFESVQGWSVDDDGDDDAVRGIWGRMNPEATSFIGYPIQPEDDHTPEPGAVCWVTDGRAGSGPGDYDIDEGKTTLFSPVWDLSSYNYALLEFWTWYSNDIGASPGQDTLVCQVSSDGGANWTDLIHTNSDWEYFKDDRFYLEDYIELTTQVRFRIIASDESPGSVVEAAVDDVCLYASMWTAEPPTELKIFRDGNDIHLYWQPSVNARNYSIRRSLDPFGTFAEIGTVVEDSLHFEHTNGAVSDIRAFYQVVATD